MESTADRNPLRTGVHDDTHAPRQALLGQVPVDGHRANQRSTAGAVSCGRPVRNVSRPGSARARKLLANRIDSAGTPSAISAFPEAVAPPLRQRFERCNLVAMGAFYEHHAARYCRATRDIDITAVRAAFLAHLPMGGRILDAGCGSGRDGRAFLDAGYVVAAFDGSAPLAELAGSHIGQPVRVLDFREVDWQSEFDGVWACASLLHVPWTELPGVVGRLVAALKPGGVLYMSFKHGRGERVAADGRFFLDLDEAGLDELLAAVPRLTLIECWRSPDQLGGDRPDWLNALARKV